MDISGRVRYGAPCGVLMRKWKQNKNFLAPAMVGLRLTPLGHEWVVGWLVRQFLEPSTTNLRLMGSSHLHNSFGFLCDIFFGFHGDLFWISHYPQAISVKRTIQSPHRCVGHTAWAPKGRDGWSQADLKGPKPAPTSSLLKLQGWHSDRSTFCWSTRPDRIQRKGRL